MLVDSILRQDDVFASGEQGLGNPLGKKLRTGSVHHPQVLDWAGRDVSASCEPSRGDAVVGLCTDLAGAFWWAPASNCTHTMLTRL